MFSDAFEEFEQRVFDYFGIDLCEDTTITLGMPINLTRFTLDPLLYDYLSKRDFNPGSINFVLCVVNGHLIIEPFGNGPLYCNYIQTALSNPERCTFQVRDCITQKCLKSY